LLEHKGQRARLLSVFIDFEKRWPVQIVWWQGFYLEINENGVVDQTHLDRADQARLLAMEAIVIRDRGKMVGAMPRILRRDYLWKPTLAEVNTVRQAIWGRQR
jgi:hypothetical protein